MHGVVLRLIQIAATVCNLQSTKGRVVITLKIVRPKQIRPCACPPS